MNNVPEFDPYQLLLKRKKQHENPIEEIPVVSFDEEDVKELEEFCKTHGILGINFKNMNPKSVLRMLKNKMGILEETTKSVLLG